MRRSEAWSALLEAGATAPELVSATWSALEPPGLVLPSGRIALTTAELRAAVRTLVEIGWGREQGLKADLLFRSRAGKPITPNSVYLAKWRHRKNSVDASDSAE